MIAEHWYVSFRADGPEWEIMQQIHEKYPHLSYTDIIKRIVHDARIKTESVVNGERQRGKYDLQPLDTTEWIENRYIDASIVYFVNDCIANELINDAIFNHLYYLMYKAYVQKLQHDLGVSFEIAPYRSFSYQFNQVIEFLKPNLTRSWEVDKSDSSNDGVPNFIRWKTFYQKYNRHVPLTKILMTPTYKSLDLTNVSTGQYWFKND